MQLVQPKEDSVLIIALTSQGWLIGEYPSEHGPDESTFDLHNVWSIFYQASIAQTGEGEFRVVPTPLLLLPILVTDGSVPSMTVTPSAYFIPADQNKWREIVVEAERNAVTQRSGLALPRGPIGDVSKLRSNGA